MHGDRHSANVALDRQFVEMAATATGASASRNVRLMRSSSGHFSRQHPAERDSHETDEFSARKSCVKKRMSIWDESVGH
jgi:hypothetical protein